MGTNTYTSLAIHAEEKHSFRELVHLGPLSISSFYKSLLKIPETSCVKSTFITAKNMSTIDIVHIQYANKEIAKQRSKGNGISELKVPQVRLEKLSTGAKLSF
jgi:hypothetical protein